MHIYLTSKGWVMLFKECDAAATGSQGFAFSSSRKYLFNHLDSWQTFSSVSLAFNSTFLTLLQ